MFLVLRNHYVVVLVLRNHFSRVSSTTFQFDWWSRFLCNDYCYSNCEPISRKLLIRVKCIGFLCHVTTRTCWLTWRRYLRLWAELKLYSVLCFCKHTKSLKNLLFLFFRWIDFDILVDHYRHQAIAFPSIDGENMIWPFQKCLNKEELVRISYVLKEIIDSN